jgi:hypothetical protein
LEVKGQTNPITQSVCLVVIGAAPA